MKYSLEWIIEISLMLFHLPLTSLNLFLNFEPVPNSTNKKTPIILVERWIERNPLHIIMKKYLEKKGFTVYSINFPLLKGTFKESAENLKKYINEKGLTDVILIGISNGGLTCYQYLNEFNGWDKTKLFIGVGAPFSGARLGFLLFFTKARKELATGSAYISSLMSKPLQHKDKIYCFEAKYDQMVGHDNSYLAGAQNIVINVAGHNLLHTLWLPTLRNISDILTSTDKN